MGNRTSKEPEPATEQVAYLNFMKRYKKRHPHLDPAEANQSAAKAWGKLTPDQKSQFTEKKCRWVKKKARRPKPVSSPIRAKKAKKNKEKKLCRTKIQKRPTTRSNRAACNVKRPNPYCKPKRPTIKESRSLTGHRKGKNLQASPAMSTGFLNFLREFRKRSNEPNPKKSLQRGARAWCKLSKDQRLKYQKASDTSKKRRKKPDL
ncbi:protamine-like protein 99C [Scaptodrosophila lebanonensis]|uniref:Protamine-like protein 99C n=1 Tax=Drosophila lebanonensis TaxID=7225 RepID=A0A6J2TAN9_DROLE|nr:protamine-like protein 99C [Scaptodrosophila lebanonensis]